MVYYALLGKNENIKFAYTLWIWIVLNKFSQRERDRRRIIVLIFGIKRKDSIVLISRNNKKRAERPVHSRKLNTNNRIEQLGQKREHYYNDS